MIGMWLCENASNRGMRSGGAKHLHHRGMWKCHSSAAAVDGSLGGGTWLGTSGMPGDKGTSCGHWGWSRELQQCGCARWCVAGMALLAGWLRAGTLLRPHSQGTRVSSAQQGEADCAGGKVSAKKDLQGYVGFILGRKAKWDKTHWPSGMAGTRFWRDAHHMCVSRPGEKFWLKSCFVSISFQWMFHECVLICAGFPKEKHWSWFRGIFVGKKKYSFSNLFYFLFLFAMGERTGDWRVATSSA